MKEVILVFSKNNEPVIIRNDKFKKCLLFISFPIYNYKEEELKVLGDILYERSEKYDTKRKVTVACINNYCLFYRYQITYIGNNAFLEFVLSYPSFNSLKKDVLLDNLLFAKEMIFNPYLENGSFPRNIIDEDIRMYKDNVKHKLKNYDSYYQSKSNALIDEDNYLISSFFRDLSLLDSITSKRLYDVYREIISKKPLVFLIGDVNENESKELIKKIILDNEISNIKFKTDYHVYVKDIVNDVKVVREDSDFSTSGVYCNYKVKDMNCYKDEVLLSVVRKLLSSNNSDLLFKYLRKDNDLVYNAGAYAYSFGTLTLFSFVGKKNIDKVFELYDKAMNDISDIHYIESKLPFFVEDAKIDSELDKENLNIILFEYVREYLGNNHEKYYDVINNIKPIEVKNFIDNRLVMVSKYIGVGVDDE